MIIFFPDCLLFKNYGRQMTNHKKDYLLHVHQRM